MKPWILMALVVGCRSDPTNGSTDGPAIFAAFCAMCHGPTGQPPAEMVARSNVRDLTAPEMRARITPALVEKQVRNGSANGLMPAFAKTITDAQIRSVAAWVADPRFVTPR